MTLMSVEENRVLRERVGTPRAKYHTTPQMIKHLTCITNFSRALVVVVVSSNLSILVVASISLRAQRRDTKKTSLQYCHRDER